MFSGASLSGGIIDKGYKGPYMARAFGTKLQEMKIKIKEPKESSYCFEHEGIKVLIEKPTLFSA